MVQGTIKNTKAKAVSSKKPNALGPKKGARTIAPKKAGLIKQKKLGKKFCAGLTAKTERTLAAKAGHLEMLKGGKKDKKKDDKAVNGKNGGK